MFVTFLNLFSLNVRFRGETGAIQARVALFGACVGVVFGVCPVSEAVAQEAATRPGDSQASEPPGPNATRLPIPPSDFTFRKIAPPAPGTTRRITVQIAPLPDPPPPVRAEPTPSERDAPFAAEPREVASFWEVIGTGRTDGGPARLIDAMNWFDRADPAPAAPALVDLMSLVEQYGREMLSVSIGTRVSPAMALAVAWTESSGQVSVVSPKGAQGLMQLIPATAERFDVADPFNAQQNLRGGVAYLNWLMERFEGDPILALAGYNAGEGAVDRAKDGAGGVPNYPETREYVVKVLSAWRVARGLCLTPPELASDGCVFAPIASSN